ncbi:DUF2922 domain-containing protein [Lactobacillus sp. ESL0677]|uniref:DUF2922 domain-containing protein n=1 Tax=Lactobacillus sp. ESL0677 TaxID=2983208 RepID=UPI0023F69049|nr:DUF2922 domain-containing protein [Lactobacillus sp. ESL0677]WEV36849.1 DUF2922 domain-containing protein [Lactobacillus sp. ESL0677]
MTKTTKTLQLVFLNGANKRSSLSLPDAANDLEPAAVKAAMDAIVKADAFQKDGVDLYKIPQSAAYIERTVTDMFDDTASEPEQPANPSQVG